MNSPAHADAGLPDDAMIARHADFLFRGLHGPVAVRMLRETGAPAAQPWTDSLATDASLGERLAADAKRAAADQRALFVVPGTLTSPGRATAGAVAGTAVILVDLDQGPIAEKQAYLVRNLGPPSLVVASGGTTAEGEPKLHLYWRLAEPANGADLERVAALRRQIAEKVGGDPSVARLHQPIRVAGSLHQKQGLKGLCRILEDGGREYALDVLATAVDAMPVLGSLPPTAIRDDAGCQEPNAAALMIRPVREHGADGITRFDALSKVIGHWIRQARLGRTTLDAAWEAVSDHNAALIIPPWDETRLRQEFESLRLLDGSRHQVEDCADIVEEPPETPIDPATGQKKPRIPTYSEDALVESFVQRHGETWRYVSAWKRWMHWTGTHWEHDATNAIHDVIRQVCRNAANSCKDERLARRLASNQTIRAVVTIAANDRRIAASADVWDCDLQHLNTPAGIVDLATGEILPHDSGRYLTQIANASPGVDCPRWNDFLGDITGHDVEVEDYLARLVGYCLSGSTEEHALFFLHGHGANGKSTFLQTLATILGSYARTAPSETFMASRNAGHPTDLAGLRGARLVLVSETEANRTWAESRIKAITSGDVVAARFMHRDFFEYKPTYKLVVGSNHLPRIAHVGEAMQRRIHLIPFDIVVRPERRDPKLIEKLLAERDGILGWALAGHANWRRQGLSPPAKITGAVRAYIDNEDTVGQWIAEDCEVGDSFKATSAELFASWSTFADRHGIDRGNSRLLGEALAARGFQRGRSNQVRYWAGLGLRRAG